MSWQKSVLITAAILSVSACEKGSGSGGSSNDAFAIQAYSKQGASQAELLADAPKAILFSLAEDGQAIAYDYNEWSYQGPTGIVMANYKFTAEEMAQIDTKLATELAFATIDNAAIDAEVKKLTAECNCSMEYGGDISTMLISVTQDKLAHSAYWRSDVLIPDGKSVSAFDRLSATRDYVLSLREQVIIKGTGLTADFAAAANAELDKLHPEQPDFKVENCWINGLLMEEVSDNVIYCSNTDDTNVEVLPSPRFTGEAPIAGGTFGAVKINTFTND